MSTPIETLAAVFETAWDDLVAATRPGHDLDEVEAVEFVQRVMARALSEGLAQHRDDIAQVMNQQDGNYQGRVSPSWEGLSEAGKAFYRSQVDALLGYLTGGEA